METDKDHIHFLVEYDATDRICDIVKVVKQETVIARLDCPRNCSLNCRDFSFFLL